MSQTLKCWVLLGRKKGQEEWQLVDDPQTRILKEGVEAEKIKKFTSVVFWDKETAQKVLEETREYASSHGFDWEVRIAGLWGEVGSSLGRS